MFLLRNKTKKLGAKGLNFSLIEPLSMTLLHKPTAQVAKKNSDKHKLLKQCVTETRGPSGTKSLT